ncbi:MAG: hypothetical protein ABSA52_06165 [Candidatus Binatia bacterium]|jgi:hypothetical protein
MLTQGRGWEISEDLEGDGVQCAWTALATLSTFHQIEWRVALLLSVRQYTILPGTLMVDHGLFDIIRRGNGADTQADQTRHE